MKFLFSQREVARQAALAAVERYPRECLDAATGAVQEFWSFVVNALLEAIPAARRELAADYAEQPIALDWRWVADIDDELEVGLQWSTKPAGWIAWTGTDSTTAVIVYESACGKRATIQMGSLDLETDVHGSWDDGKATAEVLLRHAIAANAELSRR